MKVCVAACILTLCVCASIHAEEQPPFKIADPAIDENFRRIYLLMDQHRHTGTDESSLPFNLIPSSASIYTLGNTTLTWTALYVDTVIATNVSGIRQSTFTNLSTSNFLISSGTNISALMFGASSYNYVSIATASTLDVTFAAASISFPSLSPLAANDICFCRPQSLDAGIMVMVTNVTAAGIIVRIANVTAATITSGGATTYDFLCFRR